MYRHILRLHLTAQRRHRYGHPATFVGPSDFSSPPVALALAGEIPTAVLVSRRVPAAIVLGIRAITPAGLFVPNGHGGKVTALPAAIFSAPPSLSRCS